MAADIGSTEWGYVVGGTAHDATVVNAGTIWVKVLAFAGNADGATCVITSTDNSGAAASCFKFKVDGNDLDASGCHVFFGDKGRPFTNMTVDNGHNDDALYIFLA